MEKKELNANGFLEKETIEELVNANPNESLFKFNQKYYNGENQQILEKVEEREGRNVIPNNIIQAPYVSTLVDSMAGYLGGDVKYALMKTAEEDTKEEERRKEYKAKLDEILYKENQDILDLQIFTCMGRDGVAYEIHYTTENGAIPNFALVEKPQEIIPIFDFGIKPQLIAFIRHYTVSADKKEVVVYYKDQVHYYEIVGGKLSEGKSAGGNHIETHMYDQVPLVIYKNSFGSDIVSDCHKVVGLIDMLDAVLTGNQNELDKFAEAILAVTKKINEEDKNNAEEWRFIDELNPKDIQWITKDINHGFREFVVKCLITEIHKHTHILDFHNPESTVGNVSSGKALQYRLFGMYMYSKKKEMLFKEGAYKRLELIKKILKEECGGREIEIIVNRSLPNHYEEVWVALAKADWLSAQTKCELSGRDWEEERKRKSRELLNDAEMLPGTDEKDEGGQEEGDQEAA